MDRTQISASETKIKTFTSYKKTHHEQNPDFPSRKKVRNLRGKSLEIIRFFDICKFHKIANSHILKQSSSSFFFFLLFSSLFEVFSRNIPDIRALMSAKWGFLSKYPHRSRKVDVHNRKTKQKNFRIIFALSLSFIMRLDQPKTSKVDVL